MFASIFLKNLKEMELTKVSFSEKWDLVIVFIRRNGESFFIKTLRNF